MGHYFGRHSKRLLLAWVPADSIASDATNSFAFDDDYSMGVLLSNALVTHLTGRNREIAQGERLYDPFANDAAE